MAYGETETWVQDLTLSDESNIFVTPLQMFINRKNKYTPGQWNVHGCNV